MELVMVERRFEQPVTFEELSRKEAEQGGCLEAWGVRALRSYVSRDGKRVLCLYEAPDAEAVRRVNDMAGLPYEAVWSATQHSDSTSG